jgi:hypothetical protein
VLVLRLLGGGILRARSGIPAQPSGDNVIQIDELKEAGVQCQCPHAGHDADQCEKSAKFRITTSAKVTVVVCASCARAILQH